MKELTVIGRAERADLPDIGVKSLPVKIDTGADACSIWASAEEKDGKLFVVFFGPESDFFSGETCVFETSQYAVTRVANSFGHKELRYKVKLRIFMKGRMINGSFTLSNRSNKLYPALIGRSLLRKKYIVDVSKGRPLREAEKARAVILKNELILEKGDTSL